jgi:mono/diheme cytochrome c family protein
MKNLKHKFQKQIITKLAFIVVAFMYASIATAQHNAPWNVPATVVNLKNPFSADESSLQRGKNSYKLDCLRCHGKTGKGDGLKAEKVHKQIADLGSDVIQKQSDGELFWKISEARRPMPLTDLTNDQRWDIINYIRSFKKK